MPMEQEPVVSAVYEDSEGRVFEVLSFDEDEATVELEYDDGTVVEIDLDNWYDMDAEMIETDDEDDDDVEEIEEDEDDDFLEEDEDDLDDEE